MKEFLDSKPYSVGVRYDPESRKLTYFVSAVKDTPLECSLIAGEALQNIRSALDQFAYQLFLAGTRGRQGVGRHLYFPIEPSASDFRHKLAHRTRGIRQDAIDAIASLKPYKGGWGHKLWILNELNVIDEHRSLIAVGSEYHSVDIAPQMASFMRQNLGDLAKRASKVMGGIHTEAVNDRSTFSQQKDFDRGKLSVFNNP